MFLYTVVFIVIVFFYIIFCLIYYLLNESSRILNLGHDCRIRL